MPGTFGTNLPYGAGDSLNIVGTNVGTQGALRISNVGPASTVGTSQAINVIVPAGTAFILHQVTTIGSGATGTTTGTVTTGLAMWKNLDVYVDVTAEAGAATTTLFVFVDGKHPDGTAFVNIGAFAALTTVGAHIAHLTKEKASLTTATVGVDAGLGTFRAMGWGDGLRVRTQLTGTATTVVSATVYVYNQVG